MNNFNYTNLTPFKWFVLENFPFIEADFDAITNWQLYCKIGKEINKIIDSQNLVGEQAETLTNAFNELKNYVDNLDVQNEINKKLDEMAENGELEKILERFLIPNSSRIMNKGKVIIEYPFISYVLKSAGFDDEYLVQGATYYEKDNIEHIIVAMEKTYDGPFFLVDLILTNNTVIENNVSNIFNTTGSLNSIDYDIENNRILVLYNSTIYSFNPDNLTEYTIYNPGTSLLGIAYDKDTNTLYGAFMNNTTKVNIYKLTNNSNEFLYSIDFKYTNCTLYQDITISNGILYVVYSNNIISVNLKTGEVLGIYNSLINYAEYESLIVMPNGSICPVLRPIRSHSLAITQCNLGTIYNGVIHPRLTYKTNNHLFVNESATGFLETGLSNAPIHSIEFASAYMQAYNMHDMYITGNTLQGLDLRNYNMDITLSSNDIEFVIKDVTNCRLSITSGSISGYFINSVIYFFNTKIRDTMQINNSDVYFNSFPENFFEYVSLSNCTFKGNQAYLGNMSLFENSSGYIDGSTITMNVPAGTRFNQYITNGFFIAEVTNESNGAINAYILMHNSREHIGILSGSGANSSGTPVYVEINGAGKLTCKIGTSQGYVKRIYPAHV